MGLRVGRRLPHPHPRGTDGERRRLLQAAHPRRGPRRAGRPRHRRGDRGPRPGHDARSVRRRQRPHAGPAAARRHDPGRRCPPRAVRGGPAVGRPRRAGGAAPVGVRRFPGHRPGARAVRRRTPAARRGADRRRAGGRRRSTPGRAGTPPPTPRRWPWPSRRGGCRPGRAHTRPRTPGRRPTSRCPSGCVRPASPTGCGSRPPRTSHRRPSPAVPGPPSGPSSVSRARPEPPAHP